MIPIKDSRAVTHDIFDFITRGITGLLVLFFVGIIVSLAFYTNINTFISSLFSEEIIFAIKLSVLSATVATIICIFVAVPTAYTLSRAQFPGKNIVDALLDLPIVIPPIALGTALLIFFNTPIGVPLRDYFVFQTPGIVLAQFTVITALAVRFMKNTFDNISPKYEAVARTLGCSKMQSFFKVTLPLAKKGLLAAAIIAWGRALGEFGASVTLAGATRMKTETLSVAIFLNLATADVEKAIAVIFVLIILGLFVLIIIRKIGARGYGIY